MNRRPFAALPDSLARPRKTLRAPDWAATDDARPTAILAVLMVVVAVLLMYMARGTTFYFDEWDFVQTKFGGGLQSLLLPHNEHLSLVPIAIYKVLFHLVGLNHYPVYRLALVLVHLTCVGLVYVLARRRIGPWPALIAATLFLCLFSAWDDLVWSFQIGFDGSVLGGLAAWALLDRNTRAGDVGAGIALGVALACSGLGIPFVPGLAVELAWQRRWRRLWLVAVPFVLYLLWYAHYGVTTVTGEKISQSPQWVLEAAAAAIGALAGRDVDWGVPLAVLALFLAARRVVGGAPLSGRLIGVVVTGLAFWVLTAVSRSTEVAPDTSRYLYMGAACVLIATIELLPTFKATDRTMALATLAVLAAALMGWQTLHNLVPGLRLTDQTVAAQLEALQLEAARAPASYQPSPSLAPQVTAGPYLHAVRSIGSSPAASPAAILAFPAQAQIAADAVLFQLLDPQAGPIASTSRLGAPPHVESSVSATVTPTVGRCLAIRPTAAGAVVDVTMPLGGVLIRDHGAAGVALALRRFAPTFTPLSVGIVAHGSGSLVLPRDSSAVPWHLQISGASPLLVCGLAS